MMVMEKLENKEHNLLENVPLSSTSSSIDQLTSNVCRTCLNDSSGPSWHVQDLVNFESNKVKLIDILVYLNCLENNDEKNWPKSVCEGCVATALKAYSFKLNCLKANSTLAQLLSITTSNPDNQANDIEVVDINVIYQDHEYELPLFTHRIDLMINQAEKEVAPLPPVSEITSTELPLRKEGEKKFPCTICNRSFTKIYSLRYHMAKHNNVKRHLCTKCGKKFSTASNLMQHMQTHKEIGQFKCGFCNKNYKTRQSLREHFRVAHSSNRHSFVCTLCGKSFTAKSTLVKHMQTHNAQKQFACPDCPKTYTRARYLRIHSFSHMGVEKPKPFTCSFLNCDKKFATKHSLMIHHAHTHSNNRPHSCDICQKTFVTVHALKIHKDSHTDRNISCSICSKRVGNKRMLLKHMKIHNSEVEVDPETDMFLETVINNGFFDHIYY